MVGTCVFASVNAEFDEQPTRSEANRFRHDLDSSHFRFQLFVASDVQNEDELVQVRLTSLLLAPRPDRTVILRT